MTRDPLDELTDRQRALYWLVRAEASSIDERLMIISTCARRIGATVVDVIPVREALLIGNLREPEDRA